MGCYRGYSSVEAGNRGNAAQSAGASGSAAVGAPDHQGSGVQTPYNSGAARYQANVTGYANATCTAAAPPPQPTVDAWATESTGVWKTESGDTWILEGAPNVVYGVDEVVYTEGGTTYDVIY